ncbi:SH3 domain-containing protein [Lachnospiraceae bacterium HCP1S3_C3]|nr:SH3 domain-containing protein [Lachnospiraceae bacterium]
MRKSFKFILCMISADIIIIAIVFLLNLTGSFSKPVSKDSGKPSVAESQTDTGADSPNNVTPAEPSTEIRTADTVENTTEFTTDNETEYQTDITDESASETTTEASTEETTTLPSDSFVVLNTTSKVYLRSEASTGGKIICEIPANSHGTIISTEGSWSKVKYDGHTGYVFTEYILTGTSANDYVSDLNSDKVKIDRSCNMRNVPDTSSPVIGNAIAGTEYKYIKEKSDDQWFAIILEDGSTAYISTGYATITN